MTGKGTTIQMRYTLCQVGDEMGATERDKIRHGGQPLSVMGRPPNK